MESLESVALAVEAMDSMSFAAKIHRRTIEHQEELGKKCLKLRKQGVTVPNLCQRFGVSSVTIGKWIGKANQKKKR